MKFLVSTSKGLWIVDNGVPKPIVESGDKIFFGITWDGEKVYAVRRTDAKNFLLTFDKEFKQLSETVIPGVIDAHQIHYYNRRLYVANTRFNRITFCENDLWKDFAWAPCGRDVNHINSIWNDDEGLLYFLEHNRNNIPMWRSRVKVFTRQKHQVADYQVGFGAHNVIRVEKKYLVICSSNNFSLIKYDTNKREIVNECHIGKARPMQYEWWFTRGLAYDGNNFYVGMSEYEPRDRRLFSVRGGICVVDNNFNIKNIIELPNMGQVYDLRIMNGKDFAHNGIDF